jgi:hypothetical protein
MNPRYADLLTAISFAADRHRNQRRKDAESAPYINRPLQLACLLATDGGVDDVDTLIAAVLHDTVEDTETSHGEFVERFVSKVADIVAEVTDDKSLPKVANNCSGFVPVAGPPGAVSLMSRRPSSLPALPSRPPRLRPTGVQNLVNAGHGRILGGVDAVVCVG